MRSEFFYGFIGCEVSLSECEISHPIVENYVKGIFFRLLSPNVILPRFYAVQADSGFANIETPSNDENRILHRLARFY
jgi:hypothetical protein